MKKTRLSLDALEVETFHPVDGRNEPRGGTVKGQAVACTHWRSCVCPTAYYHCGDGYETLYSCDYTQVQPCFGSYDDCA